MRTCRTATWYLLHILKSQKDIKEELKLKGTQNKEGDRTRRASFPRDYGSMLSTPTSLCLALEEEEEERPQTSLNGSSKNKHSSLEVETEA